MTAPHPIQRRYLAEQIVCLRRADEEERYASQRQGRIDPNPHQIGPVIYALAEPVSKRFAARTTRRYGALALGPNLETEGISIAGENREQLKTAVIVDDCLSSAGGRKPTKRDAEQSPVRAVDLAQFIKRWDAPSPSK